MDYKDFLDRKRVVFGAHGFEPRGLNPALFPFQRDIVRWACRKGRAAIFADCGLGKTLMQLEWAREVAGETGGRVLILAPLAVAKQTQQEGARFGIQVTVCGSQDDVQGGVNVTNYEKLHRFDPESFAGIVLDESSILKAYDGKTRTTIIDSFSRTPYRLACTATPAPNDHMELANHAEFIGVMLRKEMLSMFFTHDGGETQKWRLKRHGESDFWRWVSSWATVLRKPSDIGHDDEGFDLPALRIRRHTVGTSAEAVGTLFPMPASTLDERRVARRASMSERVRLCADMVNASAEPWLIWCDFNAESASLAEAIPDAIEVTGSDSNEAKESALAGFTAGAHRVLVSKPSIAGFGMNWQHCSNIAFVGLSDSYESFYQAIRRCWRFGQRRPVDAHVIVSELESAVVSNVLRKEADAEKMHAGMAEHVKDAIGGSLMATERKQAAYATEERSGEAWRMLLGDCVDGVRTMADDSVHFSAFSPPFASLYTYSDSERDMGNVRDVKEFGEHFEYLARELARVLMPGRLLSFHCMNLPTSITHHGYIGIQDFRGELIRAFERAGLIYHSEVCIWKDPVIAMQRTKAIGLLHKQLKKDSALSRQGIPDYLVTMRKPGSNPEPVAHTNETFPVKMWQRYASPVWMDINPSDTLQFRSAREHDDERHICPLQLEVIERAVELWTNPGDLVLSPFAGIGSEGHVAVTHGRRFLGIELKRSYYEEACRNLERAEHDAAKPTLFSEADTARLSREA